MKSSDVVAFSSELCEVVERGRKQLRGEEVVILIKIMRGISAAGLKDRTGGLMRQAENVCGMWSDWNRTNW